MEKKTVCMLALVAALALAGCASDPAPYGNKVGSDEYYDRTGMEISKIASQMGDQIYSTMEANLVRDSLETQRINNQPSPAKTAFPTVAVTSFVDTDTYAQPGYVGRELGELFVHELTRRTIPVFEYKVTGAISVGKDGELVFSRDWRKIAKRAMVQHVLAGSMTRNENGVVLVARVINIENSTVLGSATGFIPYHLLPTCYQSGKKDCSLTNGRSDFAGGSVVKTYGSGAYLRESVSAAAHPDARTKKSNTQVTQDLIDDSIPNSENFNQKYYGKGKLGGTSTGNYQYYLLKENPDAENHGDYVEIDDNVPVIYPANSYIYKDMPIRDVHDTNQYQRFD